MWIENNNRRGDATLTNSFLISDLNFRWEGRDDFHEEILDWLRSFYVLRFLFLLIPEWGLKEK